MGRAGGTRVAGGHRGVVKEKEKAIAALQEKRNEAIKEERFEDAAKLRDEERTSRAELDRERSELMGGGRPPNVYKSLTGETLYREPNINLTDWDEVDRIRAAGGIPSLRLSPAAGGPVPGKASAPAVTGWDRDRAPRPADTACARKESP